VFVPFCYYEAAANVLTNPVLDPFGKIPEFKYCAVKVTQGGTVPERMSFGGAPCCQLKIPRPPARRADREGRHTARPSAYTPSGYRHNGQPKEP
jgi:hypothetical protein